MRTTAGRPQAIIIFSDIRGFSQWSRDIDAYESTVDLVHSFQEMLRRHFDGFWMKPLGDGAMLAKLITLEKQGEIEDEINSIVRLMAVVEAEFEELTQQIEIKSGHKTDMLLGWGVTRGNVLQLRQKGTRGEDYLGHHVNKAARLCDLARPRGAVIDRTVPNRGLKVTELNSTRKPGNFRSQGKT